MYRLIGAASSTETLAAGERIPHTCRNSGCIMITSVNLFYIHMCSDKSSKWINESSVSLIVTDFWWLVNQQSFQSWLKYMNDYTAVLGAPADINSPLWTWIWNYEFKINCIWLWIFGCLRKLALPYFINILWLELLKIFIDINLSTFKDHCSVCDWGEKGPWVTLKEQQNQSVPASRILL